jgi:transposase
MPRRQPRPVEARKPPFSVGIDLGQAMPHASVVEAEGTPSVPKGLAFANTRAGYPPWCTLLTEATAPAAPCEVTVGGEATGPSWLSLSEALTAQGYPVRGLNPVYVKARWGTTVRGTKTDPGEARLIAEMRQREQVPVSHIPAAALQGWRDLTRRRADLVAQIGDVTRRIIGILDRTWPEFATCCTDVCGQAARTLWETWSWPEEVAAVPTARLAAVLARLAHGHLGAEKACEVKAAAQQSIGVTRAADALAFERRRRLRQSRALERLVAAWDQASHRRYAALDPSLRTVPGLGGLPQPPPAMRRSGTSDASRMPISWWRWPGSIRSSMSRDRRRGRPR